MALKVIIKSAFFVSMILMSLMPWIQATPPEKRGNIRLCGSMLSDALSIVCRGRYNTPAPEERKRFIASQMNNIDPALTWFFARSETSDEHEIRRRGIADECCRRTCTYSTLVSYCAA